MAETILYCSGGGNQRLAEDLTAKDPLRAILRTRSPEDVFFDRLQIEQRY